MLHQLNSIATEQDPEKRRELLSAVADLFLHTTEADEPVDANMFQGVMAKLLDVVDDPGKVDFAEKLAPSAHTPATIAERLARDENVAIAGPVLRQSPVLSDPVLVDIAQHSSQEHLKAISGRATVSEQVTDVLVERGNDEVVTVVASNDGASFSKQGFDRLAERSHSNDVLASALFARADVPKDVAVKLIQDMPSEVRNRLVQLAAENVSEASALVQKAAQAAGTKADTDQRYAGSAGRNLVASVRSGAMSMDEAVIQMARGKRGHELAMILAKLSDVPLQEIKAAMNKTDHTALAVICKQLDVTRDGFEAIAAMVGKQLSLPETHTAHFVQQYDGLNVEVASRVSRFVSVRRKLAASG